MKSKQTNLRPEFHLPIGYSQNIVFCPIFGDFLSQIFLIIFKKYQNKKTNDPNLSKSISYKDFTILSIRFQKKQKQINCWEFIQNNRYFHNIQKEETLMSKREISEANKSYSHMKKLESVGKQTKSVYSDNYCLALPQKSFENIKDLSVENQESQNQDKQISSNAIYSPNEWNSDDLAKLFSLYDLYGPKWVFIAHEFSKKSQNVVKNKFYGSLRKLVRKLNKFLKESRNKYRKQTKVSAIIRILDLSGSQSALPQGLILWGSKIRKQILEATWKFIINQKIQNNGQLQWLSENIIKFNVETRGYKPKKQIQQDIQKSTNKQISKNATFEIQQKNIPKEGQNNKGTKFGILQLEKIIDENYSVRSDPFEIFHEEIYSLVQLTTDFEKATELGRKHATEKAEKDLYYEIFQEQFPHFQFDEFTI